MGSYYCTQIYTCAHLTDVSSLLGSDGSSHPPLWHADMGVPSQFSISEADLEGWDSANWARRARHFSHLAWGANRAVVSS